MENSDQKRFVNDSPNLDDLLKETFTHNLRRGYINVKGVNLPETYAKIADVIEEFQVRDDDVWICTFPKAGTTWTQEMVWCISNDLNFEAANVLLWDRFPFLEISGLFDFAGVEKDKPTLRIAQSRTNNTSYIRDLPSPRFIKTHLPFHLLPRALREGKSQAKIIYVSRDPKDTCISYFHHCVYIEGYKGDFEQFCQLFLGDKISYCPYWDNVLSYWNRRDELKDRILFLKYAEMKKDLSSVIDKTSAFLEKPKLSGENMEKLLDHLSFEKMKINPSIIRKQNKEQAKAGTFMRCGQLNQWKTAMSPEIIQKFDEWIYQHLKNTDFTI